MVKKPNTNNWYVITGAGSTGKTTIIDILEKRNYPVVHETARAYIDQEMATGKGILDIRKNGERFQEKILQMKIEIEKKLPKDKVIFLDRGIPDSVSYYRLYGYDISPTLQTALDNCSYKKIFLLDQLPYKNDYARTESKEEQDLVHKYLGEAYTAQNAVIVRVPVMEANERVNYILAHL